MKRILVPVDGSEISLRALRHAAARAREAQGELHLLHVEPPLAYEELRVHAISPELEKVHAQAGQRVLEAAAQTLKAEGAAHQAHQQRGEIAHTIARFAAAHHIDEVVMGTRGLGALGGMLLGSVAMRVVHLTKVPVTLVK